MKLSQRIIIRSSRAVLAMLAALLLLGCFANQAIAATEFTLVKNGDSKTVQKIIISANASEGITKTAQTLAEYLTKISGVTFTVAKGDGTSGIIVGLTSDFPALNLQPQFSPGDPTRQEEYILRSYSNKLFLIGATELAVQDAVWDVLEQFGYRQFFPTKTWEVIPHQSTLQIAVDRFVKPDYYSRRFFYGHGMWGYNVKTLSDWSARNRAQTGFMLNTGHSYQSIIKRFPQTFKEHPEYLALVNGKRRGNQLALSNPNLRKFVIDSYVIPYFDKNSDADSVSLDPADGGGYDESDEAKAAGSITDQVVRLANEAAQALQKKYPGKYVGMLAYGEHSPPPTIQVDPHVIVKIQTAFIRGGFTLDELIDGWKAKGATIGIGQYLSIYMWDQSRPGSQIGSDLYQINKDIPEWYSKNARLYLGDGSDDWGTAGLGYYLAAKLLWNTAAAKSKEAIIDDFLTRAFGPAKKPMEGFYRLIYRFDEADSRPMIRSDMVARMYRFLAEAKKLAGSDAGINARLNDLIVFTRYEELFQQYASAQGAAQKKALEATVAHAYRIRETEMVHSKPIYMRLGGQDLSKEERAALENKTPYTSAEIDEMLANGVANTQTVEVGFKAKEFSRDLVPATALHLRKAGDGDYNNTAPQSSQKFYTWLNKPGEIQLRVSGGWIEHYRHIASNVQTTLFAMANTLLDTAVDEDKSVAPDGVERTVTLKSTFDGLHEINVFPPSNRAKVFPINSQMPFTMESSLDYHNKLSGSWSLYFYVPKGTKVVGGFAHTRRGSLLDGDNKKVFGFSQKTSPGYFTAQVPPGQDGKIWEIKDALGDVMLMTVPPFLAPSSEQLLLPREVVEADKG